MRASLASTFVAAMACTPALGQDFASMQHAQQLGEVLAAEEFCGLAYDQAAIAAWIDANIEPGDMEFAPMLRMMTDGAGYDLQNLTPSQKTAHCRAISQSARANGFVK